MQWTLSHEPRNSFQISHWRTCVSWSYREEDIWQSAALYHVRFVASLMAIGNEYVQAVGCKDGWACEQANNTVRPLTIALLPTLWSAAIDSQSQITCPSPPLICPTDINRPPCESYDVRSAHHWFEIHSKRILCPRKSNLMPPPGA